METYHVPVMLDESIELLDIRPGGTYVDVTFGGGGHSRSILERLSGSGRLFAFDQDRDARRNLPDDPRLVFVESNFRFMRGWLRCHGVERVDGILADLGVSSHHFDTRERGFSFRFDAPLDMRMNQRAALTAADIVNGYDHGADAHPARLRRAGRAAPAAACTSAAATASASTIDELVAASRRSLPGAESKFLSLFQALRIEVNGEMEALR
ncbi:MAG: 16S rRNA (cytosine(1402)-N(4))-methyltransferase [Alistipes sp.]